MVALSLHSDLFKEPSGQSNRFSSCNKHTLTNLRLHSNSKVLKGLENISKLWY